MDKDKMEFITIRNLDTNNSLTLYREFCSSDHNYFVFDTGHIEECLSVLHYRSVGKKIREWMKAEKKNG